MAQNKRLAAARAKVVAGKAYGLDEAVSLVKDNATAKFDETVEIALNLGIDPRHADRWFVVLCPCLTARARPCALACSHVAPRLKKPSAGADVVGAEDLMEQVQAGEIAFDRCIATPDMMALVGRLGKILGPRG